MKKLLLAAVVVAAICSTSAINAAEKNSKSEKNIVREFKADIDCPKCAEKVMNTLPYQKGVKDVDVDIKSGLITVKYNPSKSTDSDIIKSLSRLDIKSSVVKSQE